MAEILILVVQTRGDQIGPDQTMTEINARTVMFNLGPEDAIDSTTSAKIACYTKRKQLAYKLTDEGVLLLDGRGKKIHLKNGVVTLRNALGLHALPERIMTNVMREDVSLQGQRCCYIDSIGDNHVLTKQQQTHIVTPPTTQTNMLNVRKMALVDPRLLKSLHENTKPQPPVDKILHDLDAEMTSILGSDTDVSEKVRLYNQVLLRYNEMTNTRAAKPTPVVVMKSDTVDNVPAAGATVETAVVTAGQSTDPVNIVGTLPKTLQEKGRQMLSRLSKVAWNERGELMHEGVPIPASNAVDLVHDLLRNRKTARDPVGWRQFAKQMRSANIPWSSSATMPGENTCRNPHLQNAAASRNLLFPQVGNRTDRSNHRVVMIRRPCLIFIAVTIIIIVAVVVFLLAPAPREHWCPGGIVVWGDRNYTDNTMIRNASEVTAVLPLYKE